MPLAKVLLVDDNPDFLKLARHLLEPHFHVVGALEDGESAVRGALSLAPDIVLLDVALGDHNGFEVVRRLRMLRCAASIVFFSVHEDPAFVEAAIAVGASGYLFKSRIHTDLLHALHQVRAGGTFFPSRAAGSQSE